MEGNHSARDLAARDAGCVEEGEGVAGVDLVLEEADLNAAVAHGARHLAVVGVHREEDAEVRVRPHGLDLPVSLHPALVDGKHAPGLQHAVQPV